MPSKHIKNLLNTHSRVIVPDLGAFILKGDSLESIYFNEFLRFNDGVLVDYIAEQEKIDKNESAKKIKEYVDNINKQLSTSKSIELEGLGVLFLDSNDKMQLKPLGSKAPEQAPVQAEKDSGPREVFFEIEKTDTVAPAKPASKSTKKTKAKEAAAQPVAETPKKQVKEVAPVENEKPAQSTQQAQPTPTTQPTQATPPIKPEHPTHVTQQTQPHRASPPQKLVHKSTTGKNSSSKIWIGALVIIVISVIVYFVFLRNFLKDTNVNQNIIIGAKNLNDSLTTSKDSVKETPKTSDLKTKSQITDKTEISSKNQPNANLSKKSESKSVSKTEITKPKASGEKRYYLIAGCFSVEANAEKLVNKLSSEGFQAEKFVRTNNNLYYVSYSSYVNKLEATQEMDRLKAAGKSNVWILNY